MINVDGLYKITFRGTADWGMGLLILNNGQVIGADVSGVKYDGTYQDLEDAIEIALTLTVPPGATLVQGTPARSSTYTVQANVSVPKSAIESGDPVLLNLPPGPVNVIFQHLRPVGT